MMNQEDTTCFQDQDVHVSENVWTDVYPTHYK